MERNTRPTFALVYYEEGNNGGIAFAEIISTTPGVDEPAVLFRAIEGRIPTGETEGELFRLMTPGDIHSLGKN